VPAPSGIGVRSLLPVLIPRLAAPLQTALRANASRPAARFASPAPDADRPRLCAGQPEIDMVALHPEGSFVAPSRSRNSHCRAQRAASGADRYARKRPRSMRGNPRMPRGHTACCCDGAPFLAFDDASYVNGKAFAVEGGFSRPCPTFSDTGDRAFRVSIPAFASIKLRPPAHPRESGDPLLSRYMQATDFYGIKMFASWKTLGPRVRGDERMGVRPVSYHTASVAGSGWARRFRRRLRRSR
jgi:hypothetical protein